MTWDECTSPRSVSSFRRHLQNGEQLHVEVERGAAGDDPTGTPVPVRQFAREHDLPPLPHFHGAEGLVPPPYDLPGTDLELERTPPIAGAVELLRRIEPVEPAGVVRLFVRLFFFAMCIVPPFVGREGGREYGGSRGDFNKRRNRSRKR